MTLAAKKTTASIEKARKNTLEENSLKLKKVFETDIKAVLVENFGKETT